MEIEKIIYQTLRGVDKLHDKLSISTVILFCWSYDSKYFANLLYAQDYQQIVDDLNTEFSAYGVDFSINLDNPNVKMGLASTLSLVRERYDADGFYRALYEGDEFAEVIYEITKTDFSKPKFHKRVKAVQEQLRFNF